MNKKEIRELMEQKSDEYAQDTHRPDTDMAYYAGAYDTIETLIELGILELK